MNTAPRADTRPSLGCRQSALSRRVSYWRYADAELRSATHKSHQSAAVVALERRFSTATYHFEFPTPTGAVPSATGLPERRAVAAGTSRWCWLAAHPRCRRGSGCSGNRRSTCSSPGPVLSHRPSGYWPLRYCSFYPPRPLFTIEIVPCATDDYQVDTEKLKTK